MVTDIRHYLINFRIIILKNIIPGDKSFHGNILILQRTLFTPDEGR